VTHLKSLREFLDALPADLYPEGKRPVKGSFENGWPAEIQERVLKNWHEYGY
jgi:4-hydroxy-3-polyprenylbenzoate decarboxylase